MKRLLIILISMLWLLPLKAVSIHSYVSESVLSKGHFVKIRVTESGVYKITYEELKQMGLQPDAVRILGYGGGQLEQDFQKYKIDDLPSVPFYMYKGSDGVFGKGDYILFYAQGVISWQYTGLRYRHTLNTYSQYGYYFLSDNAGKQLLLQATESDNSQTEAVDIYTYDNYQLHEMDSINLFDPSGSHGGGREWYGEKFTPNKHRSFNFYFEDRDLSIPLQLYVNAVAKSTNADANFDVGIYNQTFSMPISKNADNLNIAVDGVLNTEVITTNSSNPTVSLNFSSTYSSAVGYLNYIELTATCKLRLRNGLLYARNTDYYGSKQLSRYHIAGATETTQVWNVTRLDSIYAVETQYANNELTFISSNQTLQEYVIVDPLVCPALSLSKISDKLCESVDNQDLHNLRNIELVILTNERFLSAAQQLAVAHRQADQLTVAIVTDKQVYNEFSSGTPDATAYRWLMKMLRDRAEEENGIAPKYLQLIGDGTFDNRKLLQSSGNNWLLTYQARNSLHEVKAYASDDYFTFLDDKEGASDINATMDISVGRLPVNTSEDAEKMVNKIIRYMNSNQPGSWKRQTVFLTDDGDGNMHTDSGNQAAEIVRKNNPDFIVNKIFLDAYKQETNASGESYPIAKNQLDNFMQNGLLLFDYCGHAGYNNITSEMMLTAKEVREMSNQNQGFWMLATCNFAQFDARIQSAAEEAVLNPNGGAVALMASCRTVYASQNTDLNNCLMEFLFEHDENLNYPNTIGDAIRKAKNKYSTFRKDENKLPYLLLGDPALRLHYPTDYSIQTEFVNDTLKALSVDTIKGYISKTGQDTITDFNGVVYVSVYDKAANITTLDNDNSDEATKHRYTYVDYPNMIFSGTTEVINGKYSITMMVPKDIRYNFGNGRIALYAYDTVSNKEGIGHYEKFIVGGSEEQMITDSLGPELQVYLNNPAFEDGDITDVQPHFYAHISDEHGINTIGNGIGHDLMLVIDNDLRQTFVLNDYFVAQKNSYTEGDISYKLYELEEGEHELMFRAWDLINNSSSATVHFKVVKNSKPELYSVLAYPNPVSELGEVVIKVEHDHPDAVLELRLSVYDLAGNRKLLHTQTGADDVRINIVQAGMAAGIYIYNVEIKTPNTGYRKKAGKLIVTK